MLKAIGMFVGLRVGISGAAATLVIGTRSVAASGHGREKDGTPSGSSPRVRTTRCSSRPARAPNDAAKSWQTAGVEIKIDWQTAHVEDAQKQADS